MTSCPQVAGNRVGRGERTTIIIFTILNVFLGAFLFQARAEPEPAEPEPA